VERDHAPIKAAISVDSAFRRCCQPFTFNTLLNRQAAYLLFDNPQLLTSLGLIDR